jgi:hypothetical protein
LAYLTAGHTKNEKGYSLIFYDPCYRDAIERLAQSQSVSSHLLFSKIIVDPRIDASTFSFTLYGRSIELPEPLDPTIYSIVFIGPSKASRDNFALYFYAYEYR